MEMKLPPKLDWFRFKDIHQTNFLERSTSGLLLPISLPHPQFIIFNQRHCCCQRVLGFSCSFLTSLEEHLETLESFLSFLLNPSSIPPTHSSGKKELQRRIISRSHLLLAVHLPS